MLALGEGFVIDCGNGRSGGDVGQLDEIFIEPLAIRLLRGDALFDFLIGDDASFLHVNDEHATGLQATFVGNVFGRNRQYTGFRCHDHIVVFGYIVTRRAQTIAVERGANHSAIGKCHRSRTIPWLHQAGMELVKGFFLLAHRFVTEPWLRDHHHHRVGQGTTTHDQQLEHVIELRRVRAIIVDDGLNSFDVVAEKWAFQEWLTSVHPVHVAA